MDLDPADATQTNVLLVYGFSNNLCPISSSDDKDHRRRDSSMQDDGTANSCLYNREHTFPKALGNPDLGTTGPGADLHHLRAADKKRNADRDNDGYCCAIDIPLNNVLNCSLSFFYKVYLL